MIDHFFHMAPGGIYVRQGGAPENPYSYELLPSIVHHKHFRAAYAGVQIYQGGVYPKDTWGHAFIGNIHDNAIHEEVLTPVGSTFKCEPRRDFLRANNGWFRPVSTKTGPDGNLWSTGDNNVQGAIASVALRPLGPAGVYTANYRVTSADGHVVSGSWPFHLRTPGTGTPGPPAAAPNLGTPDPAPPAPGRNKAGRSWQGNVRWQAAWKVSLS